MSQSEKKWKLFERKEERMALLLKVVLNYKNNTANEWVRLGNRKVKIAYRQRSKMKLDVLTPT